MKTKLFSRLPWRFLCFALLVILCVSPTWASYILPSRITEKITSTFGECRNSDDLVLKRIHAGIDISTNGAENTRIYATNNGYLWKVWINEPIYGNAIFLQHPDGFASVYAHLNSFSDRFSAIIQSAMVEFGEERQLEIVFHPEEFPVQRGEIIGLSGNTGRVIAPHCHVEFRNPEKGTVLNPMTFLKDVINIPDSILKFVSFRIDDQPYDIINGGTYYFSSTIPRFEVNARLERVDGYGKMGLHALHFFVDDQEVYALVFDEIADNFLESGDYIFGEGSNASNYWYKLYAPITQNPIQTNLLGSMSRFPDQADARIRIEDDWGNVKEWRFRLRRR
ncbi:MAG TPA: M23 family metallopeptidase [Thermotogota bacterium]|nr:M23 family metallopeptidase [Thermotogota bacterium]HRW91890.1 M23 family metallopeptidase [Thermotogota bacterium]